MTTSRTPSLTPRPTPSISMIFEGQGWGPVQNTQL